MTNRAALFAAILCVVGAMTPGLAQQMPPRGRRPFPRGVPDMPPNMPELTPEQKQQMEENQQRAAEATRRRFANRNTRIQERMGKLTDRQVLDAMARGAVALLEDTTDLNTRLEKQRLATPNFSYDTFSHQYGELCMGVYALLVVHRATGDERYHFNSKEMAPLVKAVCDLDTTFTYTLGF